MIWLICTLLTLLLLAVSVRACLCNKNRISKVITLLVCLFAATYVIYIPPFYVSFGLLPGVVGDLVHTLRIITIDADVTQFYDVIHSQIRNDICAQLYIILLGVLHVAMPTVSALTAITVLLLCFSSMQLSIANKRKRPMFVFSEVNERSLHFVKSLGDTKCDVVFANSTMDAVNSEIRNKHGIIFKEEGISELAIKSRKGKDIYFFCISEDEDLSLSCALQLIERYAAEKESEQEYIHIYQFSQCQDFSIFIDSANKGALDIHCTNEYEMLIYGLLDKHPLMKSGKDEVHVLLHGLSKMNMVALKAIAWCGQLCDFTLRISVVGINIQTAVDALRIEVPGLFTERYNIEFYDCTSEKEIVDTISSKCPNVNYVIVSDESDNATMEQGVLLRRLFYRLDAEFTNCPPIYCYIKEPAKFKLIQNLATAESNPKRKVNYDLTPFGSLEEVFTYESLIASPIEKLAKNVHLAYEEIFSDGAIDVQDALKRYKVFEVNKRSNRANALHIRYKLNMLGLDYTDETDVETVQLEACYTDEVLERMSIAEHDRWMAFLETEGWIPSSKEEVQAYRNSGISRGRHNCPILKMHPYICPYEELKDLSLELEGKDTTVYDKELIIRIPDILGDKWNVSGTKYKIIKMR